jgi:hypothetical protein
LNSLVRQRQKSGDDQVFVRKLDFVTHGSGCAGDPSLETHASMAEALTSELRALLRW